MDILEAVIKAIKNGNEGWFAASGREEDGETGFWITHEDYERLKVALKNSLRPVVGPKRLKPPLSEQEGDMTQEEYIEAKAKLDEMDAMIDAAPMGAKPIFAGAADLYKRVRRYEKQHSDRVGPTGSD